MDDFKKTVSGLSDALSKLYEMGNNIIPKERTACIVNGKPATVSVGLSGKMISVEFADENSANEFLKMITEK